jgi:hypothetical protein
VLTEEQINKLADANEVIDKFAQTTSYTFAIWASNVIGSINTVADNWLELQRYLKTGVTLNGAGLAAESRITAISNQTNAARQELANRQRQRQSGAFGWLDGLANSNREAKLKNVIAEGEREIAGLIEQQRRLASSTPTPTVQTFRGAGGGGGAPRRSGGGGGGAGAREVDTFARSIADLEKRLADARFEQTALIEQWDDVTILDAKMRMEALRYEQENGVKWTEEQRGKFRELADSLRTVEVQTERSKISLTGLNDAIIGFDRGEFSSLDTLEASLERIAADIPDLRSRWDVALAGLDDAQGVAFDGLTRNLEGAILGFQSLEDAAENFAKQLLSMALQAFVFKPLGMALGIPGFANGTDYAPGGLALVGEEGPELVNLPRGSQVIPNDRLRMMTNPRIMSVGSAGAGVVNQTINMRGAVDLATRAETYRLAGATKGATEKALSEQRRRSSR